MITTKAYITKVPEKGDNIFLVNIPLMADNVNNEAIFEALLSVQSGGYNDYKVGDCVFVDFEDDKYNTAIILGKLYTDVPEENNAYGLFNQLNVTGSAVLPEDTKIGKYSPQDIFNLYQAAANGTGGSINPDDLKGYVQWTVTEREQSSKENVEVYADHIRIMTGEEYDEYKKSEDFDEDLFNHTLYFLSSLPSESGDEVKDTVNTLEDLLKYDTSTLQTGDIIKVLKDSNHSNTTQYYKWDAVTLKFTNTKDGSHPDDPPVPADWQDITPSNIEEYSFKALVDTLEPNLDKNISTIINHNRTYKARYNVDIVVKPLNDLLIDDRTNGAVNYIYWKDISDKSSPTNDYNTCYQILGQASSNTSYASHYGGRNPNDWSNFTSEDGLKIGDIVTFFKDSKATYIGVYAGSSQCYCSDNFAKSNSVDGKLIKTTLEDIEQRFNTEYYAITRVTNTLVDRHKPTSKPINDAPKVVGARVSPANSGTVTGMGAYDKGSTVTLTAQPEDGFEFIAWADGVKTATRTITVTDDIKYDVYFEEHDDFQYDVKIPMPSSGEIDFLYTSDIHVGWKDFGSNRWGSQVFSLDVDQLTGQQLVGGDVKAYQNKLKNANIPTYLLDCGDWSKSTNYSNSPGKSESDCVNHAIEVMQEMDYLGITTGNWEFKWSSMNTAMSYLNKMKDYGLMACNVNNAGGDPLYPGGINSEFPGCKTLKVGNKKIAIIAVGYPSPNGFDTYGTAAVEYNSTTYRWNYKENSTTKYRWYDSSNDSVKQQNRTVSHDVGGSLYGRLQNYINKLKGTYNFDYVIVFSHMDKFTDENYTADKRFYSRADFTIMNTSGIDVLIPGHLNSSIENTYTFTWKDETGSGIVAPEAGGEMNSFGRLRINLNNDTITCKLLTSLSDLETIN